MNMVETYKSSTWFTSRGWYTWTACEHCLVLTGYDSTYYYFNDPLNANGRVKYKKSLVNKRYTELGKQAVVVMNK